MSTCDSGYINYAEDNDSYDWDDVTAGTATLKTTTVLNLGDAFNFLNHPNAPSSTQWVELVGDGSTQLGSLLPSGASLDPKLTADTVVTIPAGSTTSEIQAIFDAQPVNLNNFTLRFQLENGTYAITEPLVFKGFHGGTVRFWGDSATTGSGVRSVLLRSDLADSETILFRDVSARLDVAYIHFNASATFTTTTNLISIRNCTDIALTDFRVADSDLGTYAQIGISTSKGAIGDGYISNATNAIDADRSSIVTVRDTMSFGTSTYDLFADNSIVFYDGNVTTDSVTHSSSGGGHVSDDTGWL